MSEQAKTTRRTSDQWQSIVQSQIESGLSGAAFCKAEGIQYQSFMSWRKKLSTNDKSVDEEPLFVELTQGTATSTELSGSDEPPRWQIELDLAPGIQLRIAR